MCQIIVVMLLAFITIMALAINHDARKLKSAYRRACQERDGYRNKYLTLHIKEKAARKSKT